MDRLLRGSLRPSSPPNGRHNSKCPVDGSYYKRYNYPLMWLSIILSQFFPCRNFSAENSSIFFSDTELLFTQFDGVYNIQTKQHLSHPPIQVKMHKAKPYNNSLGNFIHIPARRHDDEKPHAMFRIFHKVSRKRLKHGNSAVYFHYHQYLTGVSLYIDWFVHKHCLLK